MKTPPSDDSAPDLDARLRQAPALPLPDDGFSARVMCALPPRRRALRRTMETRRRILCSLGLAAGLLLGLARNDETTWAPVLALLEKFSNERSLEALLRWDSPWWITALVLGGLMRS